MLLSIGSVCVFFLFFYAFEVGIPAIGLCYWKGFEKMNDIITKYLQGEASDNEKQMHLDWLRESE